MTDRHERRGGYLSSALVFAGITALWAWIVRDDPYYRMTEIFGITLPVATVFYLVFIPALGLMMGRWRYDPTEHGSGVAGVLSKALVRAGHFAYSHLLIVLFTAAMLTDRLLALNIDDVVQTIDDNLFDLGSRFAPWLSAYLAGFNVGRASTSS